MLIHLKLVVLSWSLITTPSLKVSFNVELSSAYASEFNFVGFFNGAEPRNLFDVSKFSHSLLRFNVRF